MPKDDHRPTENEGTCAEPDPSRRADPRDQKRPDDDVDADRVGDEPPPERRVQATRQRDVRDENQQAADRQQEQALVNQLHLDVPKSLAAGPVEQAQHHPADDHEGGGGDHRHVVDPPQGKPTFVRSKIRLTEMRKADEHHRHASRRIDGSEPGVLIHALTLVRAYSRKHRARPTGHAAHLHLGRPRLPQVPCLDEVAPASRGGRPRGLARPAITGHPKTGHQEGGVYPRPRLVP